MGFGLEGLDFWESPFVFSPCCAYLSVYSHFLGVLIEQDGIWLNVHDRVGTIMSSIVWVLVCKFCADNALWFWMIRFPYRPRLVLL